MLTQTETALTQRLEARLTPFLEQVVTLMRLPGLAVGAVQGYELVYTRCYGTTSLNGGDPVTPETMFHMASITKPFVGTALMQFVEAGELDLDAPITAYLPYFRLNDPRIEGVTSRRMLAHTSGMPDTDDYGWDKPEYDDGALERYVRSLNDLSLESDPGTKYAYSNIAYEVLGDLVAKLAGESFEDRVARTILRPLGMERSTLLVREADPALLATGHVLDERGEIVVSEIFPYNRAHGPSSTLYTNLVELACWAAANIAGGELAGRRILRPETHAAMLQPIATANPEFQRSVGISWRLMVYRGARVVQHDGADTGFTSDLVLLPERDLGFFVMTNTDVGYVPEFITSAALEVALG